MMRMCIKSLVIVVLSGAAFTAQAQLACDEQYVQLGDGGTSIDVSSTNGGDDTANLQCALNEAAGLAIPLVKLAAGEYRVGQIEIADFEGTLEGKSRTATTVFPTESSVACDQQQASNRQAAYWKFAGGAVQVRTMNFNTVAIDNICKFGNRPEYLLHFTGVPGMGGCGSDVIQSGVDRVDFFDDYFNGYSYDAAVAAMPEDRGECQETLLGTFKVNRSHFEGMPYAIEASLRGSGQLDINFNYFETVDRGITFIDANQSSTILRNEFVLNQYQFNETSFDVPAALWSVNTATGPAENRISIENNTVNVGQRPQPELGSVFSVQSIDGVARINLSVRNNRVNFALTPAVPMSQLRLFSLTGVDDASIAGNRVTGDGQGFFVQGVIDKAASGNALTGNNFDLGPGQVGISLGFHTEGNTIGPNQNAVISAEPDNFVASEGNTVL